MELLTTIHWEGIIIGISTFLIIGLFHPIVIKAEYYWGTRCWWIFLVLGILGIAGSLLISDILLSSLLGVFSFSSFWTIKEVFDQRERVLKGWFPMNAFFIFIPDYTLAMSARLSWLHKHYRPRNPFRLLPAS